MRTLRLARRPLTQSLPLLRRLLLLRPPEPGSLEQPEGRVVEPEEQDWWLEPPVVVLGLCWAEQAERV